MNFKKIGLSVLAVSAAGSVTAADLEFKAPLSSSNWKLTVDTPLNCTLEHEIPDYGKVLFVSEAGKNHNLAVKFSAAREPVRESEVIVRAVAPNYRPGVADEHITSMKNLKYFGGEISGLGAMNIISSLMESRNIAFIYNDPLYRNKQLQVTVNTINFRPNYRKFENCQAKLLPYSFDDISYTIVGFKPGTNELTDESKRKLDMLITYLSNDPNVDDLVIDSYTDSFGTAERNRQISKERAVAIGRYIEQSGIGPELMQKNGYGEKQHIMTNATEEGRNLNRRVVISVNHGVDQQLNFRYGVDENGNPDIESDKTGGLKESQEQKKALPENVNKDKKIKDDNGREEVVPQKVSSRTVASTDKLMKDIEKREQGDINEISAAQGKAPSLDKK